MIFKGYIYFMNTPHCPQFKSKNTVPIVYGLIDDFGQEKDKRRTREGQEKYNIPY